MMSMSMSMSMSMPLQPHTPTVTPGAPTEAPVVTSPAPQGPIVDDDFASNVGCDEQLQTTVTLDLEIETAVGKATFTTEVAKALEDALSDEYSFCDFTRRKKRQLMESPILVGDVTVAEEAGKSE
jgi:hypothetical protein